MGEKNNVIGKDGDIPWRGKLKGEQKLFKEYTDGCAVIMGRKTWESIPAKVRPLPRRLNIVVTSTPNRGTKEHIEVSSIEEALLTVEMTHGYDEAVFIGGSRIYEEGMEYCDELWLTIVRGDFEGDTYFPEWDPMEWTMVHQKNFPIHEGQEYEYNFGVLERIKSDKV